jgi:hypothetical protein
MQKWVAIIADIIWNITDIQLLFFIYNEFYFKKFRKNKSTHINIFVDKLYHINVLFEKVDIFKIVREV